MSKIEPFFAHSAEYDEWFEKNHLTYASELAAIKSLLPLGLRGIEIGVGTGRFAQPLGIKVGVEPSSSAAKIAQDRGIQVFEGVAEELPMADDAFDFVLMVTAICFFEDVLKAFKEAHRITGEDGFLVVAFIDKESDIGKQYQVHKRDNKFYQDATFYSVDEITEYLKQAGYTSFAYKQTVYTPENITHLVQSGHGEGGFVVIKASK